MAFVELRARLRATDAADFPNGEHQRRDALSATEHDYTAIVSAGAEAARLQAELEVADRETTQDESDAATLVIGRMVELVRAAAERLPD
ncbi:MAG: hypothetical protein M3340_14905 [Actinomycetota bacterium]|nr:hypothetical protein [Actinomycetota bacterium]